jgi:hypothetical protein
MLTYLRVYDRFDSWLIGWYFSPRFIFKEGLSRDFIECSPVPPQFELLE